MDTSSRKQTKHRKATAGASAGSKRPGAKSKFEKGQNFKAFTVAHANRKQQDQRKQQSTEHRRTRAVKTAGNVGAQDDLEPPIVVVVQGPKGSGKSTLIRSLVKKWTRTGIRCEQGGPVTVVSGRNRRVTLIECANDLHAMTDLAKVADLCLLTINAKVGFEMDTFEFISILQVHGFPRVMGVLTHIDSAVDTKAQRKLKHRLKTRFWKEIYDGAKLFYCSGISHNKYPKREMANLARFVAQAKFKQLQWRAAHPYLLVDRVEALDEEGDNEDEGSVALFGYLRGGRLRTGARAHLLGVQDFTLGEFESMDDPCPLPEEKKRSLNDRETLLYAPMLPGVGNLIFDRDAVYVSLPPKVSNAVALANGEGSNSLGARMIRDLRLDPQAKDESNSKSSGIQLFSGGKTIHTVKEDDDDAPLGEEMYENDEYDEEDVDEESELEGDESELDGDESGLDEEDLSEEEEEEEESEREDDDDDDDSRDEMDDEEEDSEEDESQDEEDFESSAMLDDEAESDEEEEKSEEPIDYVRLVYGGGSLPTATKKKSKSVFDDERNSSDEDSDDDFFRPVGSAQREDEASAAASRHGALAQGIDTTKPVRRGDVKLHPSKLQGRFSTKVSALNDDGTPAHTEGGGSGDEFEDLEFASQEEEKEDDGEVELGDDEDDIAKQRAKRAQEKAQRKSTLLSASSLNDEEEDEDAGGKQKTGGGKPPSTATTPVTGLKASLLNELATQRRMNMDEFKDVFDPVQRAEMEGLRPGAYVRVVLRGVPSEFLERFKPSRPIILGGLNPHELQVGFLRARVKKHRWFPKILKTNDPLVWSVGWRRFQSLPLYSLEDQTEGRQRSIKYTPEHMHCMATLYGPMVAPNTGILAFQDVRDGTPRFRVSVTGTVVNLDKSAPVVKKLRLVGAPYKIFKKTAFIKDMFTSELEVAKYEGAALKTVSGIRGMIKRALPGETGNFRATFEDKILLSDIVFLRAWVPIEPKQLYNPVQSLLEDWDGGMKTVAELRREKNLAIPSKGDSVYRPIVREERRFHPLRVPTSLQAQLPFASKPKIDRAITSAGKGSRHRSKRGEMAERRAVVHATPQDRKVYTLIQQLNTVRQDKEALKKQQTKERVAEHRKKLDLEAKKFSERSKNDRKALSRKRGKSAGAASSAGGKRVKRNADD